MESPNEELLPDDLVYDDRIEDEDGISDSNQDFDRLSYKDLVIDGFESEEGNDYSSLNSKYREILQDMRMYVIMELQRCKERQARIDKKIQEMSNQTTYKPPSRKNWYNLFGFPYFKDRNFFPCPVNEDYYEKRSKNEIDYHHLQPPRRWLEEDCCKLEEAVKANAVEMSTTELMKRQGIILLKLKNSDLTKAEKKNLSTKLKEINNEIDKVKETNPVVLYGDLNKPFDWLKITAEAFGETRSSEEVQAMWVLCRHPSINRRHWTQTENAALKEIAVRSKEQNWVKIAAKLNTDRSEFQCIIQYQRHLNTEMLNHKWTEEEDETLRYLVEKCRVGNFIPWATVTMCMSNRTRNQVYNRWHNSSNPQIKKGRFTTEEDCLVMAGVKHFGPDFTRVATLVPGRTTTQVYARYMYSLVRTGPLGRWTMEEDKLLMKIVDEGGCKKWSSFTPYFQNRSRSQIRHRYLYLKKWQSKFPHFSISEAPRRNLGDTHKRNSFLWSKIQMALKSSSMKAKQNPKKCGAEEDTSGGKERETARQKKNELDLDNKDLAVLHRKLTSTRGKEKWTNVGRKKKLIMKSDRMLDEFFRVAYLRETGRKKVKYTPEELKRRYTQTMKFLEILQVRLDLSFDESFIREDKYLNESDLYILLKLKDMYNEWIHSDSNSSLELGAPGSSSLPSTSNEMESSASGSGALPSTSNLIRSDLASPNQGYLPFFSPDVTFSFSEVFPPNMTNIICFRTVLLSRANLKRWESVPKKDVLALPSLRPPKQENEKETTRKLTKEQSLNLFSERLFTMFLWPSKMTCIMPSKRPCEPEEPKEESPGTKGSRKGRVRKTLSHAIRKKRKMMKSRWKKLKEERNSTKDVETPSPSSPKRIKLQMSGSESDYSESG